MKIKKIISIMAMAVMVFFIACKPDSNRPGVKNGTANSADTTGWVWSDSVACRPGVHSLPNPGCSNSLLMQLVQVGSWANIGQVTVQADPNYLYFMVQPTSTSLKIKRGWFWLGPQGTQPPLTGSGDIAYANFPYRCEEPGAGANPFVMMMPASMTFACNAVSIYAQFEYVDPDFPDDPSIQPYWAAIKSFTAPGQPLQDFVGNFCYETWSCAGVCPTYAGYPGSATCPPVGCSNCNTFTLSSPNLCITTYIGWGTPKTATLTVNVTGTSPTATYTYLWNDPANSTTQSITVSPTTTRTYTVQVSDGNTTQSLSFTVYVIDARCGTSPNNPKVLVCHIPPGNPGNPQTICISPSALPAHVAEFRSPRFNPRLGHDSGCKIGPCNAPRCPSN